MTKLSAGIDLGCTTIGGVLGDAEGYVIAEASIATELYAGP